MFYTSLNFFAQQKQPVKKHYTSTILVTCKWVFVVSGLECVSPPAVWLLILSPEWAADLPLWWLHHSSEFEHEPHWKHLFILFYFIYLFLCINVTSGGGGKNTFETFERVMKILQTHHLYHQPMNRLWGKHIENHNKVPICHYSLLLLTKTPL